MAFQITLRVWTALFWATAAFSFSAANAEEKRGVTVELNKSEDTQSGCRLTFVVSNHLASGLEKLAYEVVLFDQEARVERMTVFDFKDINSKKSRVRQFQLTGSKCKQIGQFLINGAATCEGTDLSKADCEDQLTVLNKTEIKLMQ